MSLQPVQLPSELPPQPVPWLLCLPEKLGDKYSTRCLRGRDVSPTLASWAGQVCCVILQAVWHVSQRAGAGPSCCTETHMLCSSKHCLCPFSQCREIFCFPSLCREQLESCCFSWWHRTVSQQERHFVQCRWEARGLREQSCERQVEDTKRTKSLSGGLFENCFPCKLKICAQKMSCSSLLTAPI